MSFIENGSEKNSHHCSPQLMANCIAAKRCLRHALFKPDLRLTVIASFPSLFFQLLKYSRQRPSFSALCAARLMTKFELTFPTFSLRFVDFGVQFLLRCKFPFHEKRRSIFLDQSQLFATHSNQWDYFILYILCVYILYIFCIYHIYIVFFNII